MQVQYKDMERNIIFLYSSGISLEKYLQIAMLYILRGNIVIYPALVFSEGKQEWQDWLNKLNDTSRTELMDDIKLSDYDRIFISNEVIIVTKNNIKNETIENIEKVAENLNKPVNYVVVDTD